MTEQELAELRKRLGLHGWDDPQTGAIWGVPWYGTAEGGGGSPTFSGGGGGAADAASFGLGAGAGGSYNDGAGGFYSANLANLLQPGGSAGNEGSAPSGDGVGMNATTTSFSDMLGSLTGPVGAMTSVFGQSVIDGLRGNTTRPITSAGLGGLWDSISHGGTEPRDVTGTGQGYSPTDLTGVTQGNPETGGRGYADSPTGGPQGAVGTGDGGNFGDGSGMAEGGPVTMGRLMGPDPAGPDDGFTALDAGENVIPTELVEKMGGQEGVEMIKRMFASGKLTLADIMRSKAG